MSIKQGDMNDGVRVGASQLLARGAGDDVGADRRILASIADYFVDDDDRIDDQSRSRLAAMLSTLIHAIERELRQFAARQLSAVGTDGLAALLGDDNLVVLDRLSASGGLRDGPLMRELLARARQDILTSSLPANATEDAARPEILIQLRDVADAVVASAASALHVAEARRRFAPESGAMHRSDLPAELHHQLVWAATAAIREHILSRAGAEDATGALDRALTDSALRNFATHDEGARLEAAAMRLARALDLSSDELPSMLTQSIADRRLALFIALLAHALRIDYGIVREIVVDPISDRLWFMLRRLGLERASIGAIGLALCEADPRRDIEKFADMLDSIMVLSPEAANIALSTLTLHPDFRSAVQALAKADRQ